MTFGLVSTHILLQLWFTAVLRDGIATGASGGFAPFKEIGTYHLQRMLAQAKMSGDHSQAVQTVLSGFDDATCLDDVAPAFKQMHAKGIKVNTGQYMCVSYTEDLSCNIAESCMQISTMTNGSIAITKNLLQKAQLDGFVHFVMDITQPRAWKPSPAAYRYAVKQLNLEPQQARLH